MAFLIELTGAKAVHDESDGLQNEQPTGNPENDNDGNDIAVSALPAHFAARLVELGLDPDSNGLTDDAIGAALSGYDGSNGGQDVFTVSTNGSTVNNLALTNADGDPLDGVESGLFTVDGVQVFLYTDPTNDNIVLG
ncbi:MAG: hypothetical protein OES26_26650, partial [Gammaproteobacteria bacterium]|nr:hypothetical protein [Gammaproteobacteria bacterium]